MPNFRVVDLQTNFTAGEIGPLMYGRTDLKKYRNAVASLQNMVVMPQGGIARAPGTIFCAEAKVTTNVILIPFQYNLIQAYHIEMGASYFRFYKDEGQIYSGASPYEISHTYTDDEVLQVSYLQSADVLYLFHGNHIPAKLSRTAHTSWTLVNTDLLDGPYLPINNTATTLAPSATTGSITITASTSLFASTDVGRLVRMLHGSTWGYAKITAYSSATSVSATVVNAFGGTGAVTDWRLGAFSGTTGYPYVGMFHDERLWLACTDTQPDGLWGSYVGEYENFAPSDTDGTVTDSHSVYGVLSSDQVNAINWLISSNKGMLLGTIAAEWSVTSGSVTDTVITPTSKSIRSRTNTGSAEFVRPVKINNVILFAQYMKKKVYEFAYKYENDDYVAVDVSILAWHLIKNGVRCMAYQQEPFGIVWIVTEDDNLVGMTYLRDQDVVAFYPRVLGGTDVQVKWVSTIPSRYIEYSQLWLVVRRTINGATKQYIEYVDKMFETDDLEDKSEAYFVDCGLKYSGVAISVISGLDHLIGQTVQVLANGVDLGDFTVSATGTVTLPSTTTKACVGLGNEVEICFLPIESQGLFGTIQGQIKRVHETVLRLHQSDLSAWAYFDEYNKDMMNSWRD